MLSHKAGLFPLFVYLVIYGEDRRIVKLDRGWVAEVAVRRACDLCCVLNIPGFAAVRGYAGAFPERFPAVPVNYNNAAVMEP